MLKLRTDTRYISAEGKMTQAGVEAIQGQIDAVSSDTTALTTRVTTLEARPVVTAPGSAPLYACRAWVNFNGTGTVAIRASGNVASITDNGVGDYTINFTTAMPDANYVVAMSYSNEYNIQHGIGFLDTQLAGSVRVKFYSAANSANTVDKSIVNIAIFR